MANVANNGSKWIRKERRWAIYRRDNYSCVYCGKEMDERNGFSLDHVVPQILGGTNKSNNLVTSCLACNKAKGNKTLKKFISYLESKNVDTSKIARRVRNSLARKVKY